MRDIQHFINERFVPAANGQSFDKRSPLDNCVIAKVHEGGQAEADAAVSPACTALHGK